MSGDEGLRAMGLFSWEKRPLRKKPPATYSPLRKVVCVSSARPRSGARTYAGAF